MADHPIFEYTVYGRPVSIQPKPRAPGGKPKKSAALPAWRDRVKQAFGDAWDSYSKDVLLDPLRLELVWVYDARKPNVPDLDNIVKPFIDAPQDFLYLGDALFREVHLFKFERDEPRRVDVSSEKLAQPLASREEFVFVRITPIRPGAVRLLTLLAVGDP